MDASFMGIETLTGCLEFGAWRKIAEHIGLEIKDVALNPCVEIDNTVATDAPFENTEDIRGSGAQEFGGGHHGISLAEACKVIGGYARIAVVAATGAGITLEDDSAVI